MCQTTYITLFNYEVELRTDHVNQFVFKYFVPERDNGLLIPTLKFLQRNNVGKPPSTFTKWPGFNFIFWKTLYTVYQNSHSCISFSTKYMLRIFLKNMKQN